jgi:hypothetical protein
MKSKYLLGVLALAVITLSLTASVAPIQAYRPHYVTVTYLYANGEPASGLRVQIKQDATGSESDQIVANSHGKANVPIEGSSWTSYDVCYVEIQLQGGNWLPAPSSDFYFGKHFDARITVSYGGTV